MDGAKAVAIAREAAFAVNSEGQIIAWNEAAEDALGYRSSEVVGRCCWRPADPVFSPSETCAVARSNGWPPRSAKELWQSGKCMSTSGPDRRHSPQPVT